MGLMD